MSWFSGKYPKEYSKYRIPQEDLIEFYKVAAPYMDEVIDELNIGDEYANVSSQDVLKRISRGDSPAGLLGYIVNKPPKGKYWGGLYTEGWPKERNGSSKEYFDWRNKSVEEMQQSYDKESVSKMNFPEYNPKEFPWSELTPDTMRAVLPLAVDYIPWDKSSDEESSEERLLNLGIKFDKDNGMIMLDDEGFKNLYGGDLSNLSESDKLNLDELNFRRQMMLKDFGTRLFHEGLHTPMADVPITTPGFELETLGKTRRQLHHTRGHDTQLSQKRYSDLIRSNSEDTSPYERMVSENPKIQNTLFKMMSDYNKWRWEDLQKRKQEEKEIQDYIWGDTDMPNSLKEIINKYK
tara:strand:- start:3 stop:1049 length:1047 start_codon:yes stop_codon:yes gene_type:complete